MTNAKDPRAARTSPDVFTDDGGAHFTIANLDRHQSIALMRICARDSQLFPLGYVLGEMLFSVSATALDERAGDAEVAS